MFFDATILFYVALFAGTLLFIEGVYFFLHDWRTSNGSNLNRRLALASRGNDARNVLRKMRREDQDLLSRMFIRLLPFLEKILLQSGSTMSLTRLMVIIGAVFACILAAIRIATPTPLVLAALIALVIAIALPMLFLSIKRHKRIKKFGAQLPEALDLIVRSVLAGHPISSSFALVAKEMPDPIGSEFGVILDEMTYGLDMDEALDNLYVRVPHPDLHYFTLAVQIQHGTGGNVAEVLSNLSKVIRDRFRMIAKVRSVSAEGRLSAIIISLMPLIVVGVVNVLSPSYFADVIHDPYFWPPITVGIVLLGIGLFLIWKMVNFRF